ncbi:MAG: hypothetical protein EYC70_03365 [Planctomycetota bacterium]|nr:MAG: hypothetical protein EYC70_03365 [Planctomycetota bacterium]
MALAAQGTREVALPGCKSLSARALILSALADGESRLHGLSDAEDTRDLAAALAGLGVGVDRDPMDGVWRVRGLAGPPRVRGARVDVGAGAASLRFLLCLLAAGETDVIVTGSPRLFARPHHALFDFLRSLGTRIDPRTGDGRPGVRVQGRRLPAGEWRPPLQDSSQFLSGLLLVAGCSGPVFLRLEGPIPSAGYVDLSLEALAAFRGPLAVRAEPGGLRVQPGLPAPADLNLPGDPSAATFFLVALCLRGGRARLQPPWSPVHPEARLHRSLFDAGLLRGDESGLEATGKLADRPLDFDLDPAPDAGPALAVLGAFLPRGARLRRVARLRLKESDRVQGILRLLAALGAQAELRGEDLWINGGLQPDGVASDFDAEDDHRLAMAAGVAALRCPRLRVLQPECVAKSFPRFWKELAPWTTA